MAKTTLVYHGPQVRVVALDREVSDGDSVVVEDKAVADALLCAHGFSLKHESKAEKAGD